MLVPRRRLRSRGPFQGDTYLSTIGGRSPVVQSRVQQLGSRTGERGRYARVRDKLSGSFSGSSSSSEGSAYRCSEVHWRFDTWDTGRRDEWAAEWFGNQL
ncbi:hypothetical protein HHUSO_G21603 [Huso huso]|uniref:MHC class I antigen n=1 Tax=Huso huso TaxID=61971 RepID=A0ABR0YZH6_HUSHU